MNPDEQILLSLARDGDVDAFNRLVLLHQRAVFGFTLRLVRDEASANDIVQDAFIAAFRSISALRSSNVRAWLMRIARNKAYDHFRRLKRRRETSVDDDEGDFVNQLVSEMPKPEESVLAAELREAIERCIGRLSDDQRATVLLVDVEGMSYDAASEATGASVGTVKSRLSRARRRVRDCLRRTPELLPRAMRGDKK